MKIRPTSLPPDATIIGRDLTGVALTPGPIHDLYQYVHWAEEPYWRRVEGSPPKREKFKPRGEQNPYDRRYGICDGDGRKYNRALAWILAYRDGKLADMDDGLGDPRQFMPPADPPPGHRRRRAATIDAPASSLFEPEPEPEPREEDMTRETPVPGLDPYIVRIVTREPDGSPATRLLGVDTLARAKIFAEARSRAGTLLADPAIYGLLGTYHTEVIQSTSWNEYRPEPAPSAPARDTPPGPLQDAPPPTPQSAPSVHGPGHDHLHMAMIPPGGCLDPNCVPQGIRSDLARRLEP
jgi:hypothetical protein